MSAPGPLGSPAKEARGKGDVDSFTSKLEQLRSELTAEQKLAFTTLPGPQKYVK